MIRVCMCVQDARDSAPSDADLAKTAVQNLERLIRAIAAIHQRDAIAAADHKHVDVVQLKVERQPDPPKTGRKFEDRAHPAASSA